MLAKHIDVAPRLQPSGASFLSLPPILACVLCARGPLFHLSSALSFFPSLLPLALCQCVLCPAPPRARLCVPLRREESWPAFFYFPPFLLPSAPLSLSLSKPKRSRGLGQCGLHTQNHLPHLAPLSHPPVPAPLAGCPLAALLPTVFFFAPSKKRDAPLPPSLNKWTGLHCKPVFFPSPFSFHHPFTMQGACAFTWRGTWLVQRACICKRKGGGLLTHASTSQQPEDSAPPIHSAPPPLPPPPPPPARAPFASWRAAAASMSPCSLPFSASSLRKLKRKGM